MEDELFTTEEDVTVVTCEFGIYNVETNTQDSCSRAATVYGGYSGSGSWAGYACSECAENAPGFNVWDRLTTTTTKEQ